MKKDKRFLLFVFDDYYPSGAMEDLENSYDTLEEAKIGMVSTSGDYKYIYDRVEGYICHTKDD